MFLILHLLFSLFKEQVTNTIKIKNWNRIYNLQKKKSQYQKIINKTHYVQIYETFYIQTIKQINEIQRIYTITHYDTIQNN